ncbi:MAG: hypothetical protein J1E41_07085 [Ruminococcus sp.]|nr:hypothetical protein [Ruminococcus sp.]
MRNLFEKKINLILIVLLIAAVFAIGVIVFVNNQKAENAENETEVTVYVTEAVTKPVETEPLTELPIESSIVTLE